MKTDLKKIVKKPGSTFTKAAKKENPFDKFANPRKKHDILNRRVKGEDRNVGRARGKAIDERKKKLLQDYRSTKKSNNIIDKRFGESDPTMSLEEKMFLRFQKERSKKARNSSLYNLGENNEELLTHKGQILGESNLMDNDFVSSDDEEDGNGKLNKEVVNSLHFGGGFVPKDQSENHVGKKGRLEALQEIVMKSKMFKAQRKEAKEEQESARMRIDAAFDDLVKSDLVDLDEKRFKKSLSANEVDDYDKLMVDMANETKAQPAERTKTAEELALEEREKMEELEKARLKRMREATSSSSSGPGADGTNKKPRVRNDDELDDVYFDKLKEDRYGDKSFTRTEEPLPEDEDEEEEEDQDEEEEDQDEEEEDEDEEEDYDDEEEGEDEGEDGLEDDDEIDGFDNEEEDESEDEEELEGDVSSPPANFEHIPHTILCPSDSAAFDGLLRGHCKYFPHDQMETINRIVSWNNVHLPGEKGQENKKLMHNFLDILMKYFVRLGGKLPTVAEDKLPGYKLLLNHLNRVIFAISRDLSDSSVSLWSRTIKIIYQQYQKQSRDFAQGVAFTCWPSIGKLMLFQSLGHVFATTDLRNDMVNPSELILCQWLSQCPIRSIRDLASGIFTAGVLMDYSVESRRLYPEVISFVAAALAAFAPGTFTHCKYSDNFLLGTLQYDRFTSLFRESLAEKQSKKQYTKATKDAESDNQKVTHTISWSVFSEQTGINDDSVATTKTVSSLLFALYELVEALVERVAHREMCHHSAAPEVLYPIVHVLQVLRPHDAHWHERFQRRHLQVLERVLQVVTEVRETRVPLLWRKRISNVVDSKAPRFEAHYVIKKDQDSDKDRAKLKQLTRQLKREKKAAMRELRRDSAFLDQEKFQEKQALHAAKRAERVKNYAWLEDQQATINEQVRKGKGLMKGGGSGVAKGPRPGRR